ncbi:MAG TPA: phosphoribosylformylglycinamidine synthase subunit PurQ [Solirubrobacteraceae bacterium]|nr:phosphoribosylformylglycinamidine synthase subunit PurQ [Solirubrobacteraceae bacterium]
MRIGVVRFPGSCDHRDTIAAASAVGEAVELWHADRDLRGADAVIIPGGFSYGDYLRAGAIARFAPVMEAVGELAAAGGPVLGICNGFQVLCEAGLLPGALLPNISLRFRCVDVRLEVSNPRSPFLAAVPAGAALRIPAKHSIGRYYAPAGMLRELEERGQVILRYAPGESFNGSVERIAAVSNAAGNVMGMMPHPEHAVRERDGSADGRLIFASLRSAVAATGAGAAAGSGSAR